MNKSTTQLINAALIGIVGAAFASPVAFAKDKVKMVCEGGSACKGQGACGANKNANDCKGQGLGKQATKKACTKGGGKWVQADAKPAADAAPAPAPTSPAPEAGKPGA